VQPYRAELLQFVQSEFSSHELWAWKDPRCSLLLPLWRDVLTECGIDLACLLAVRNPLDVARSLAKRNAFREVESFGIWLNYNLGMLRETRDLARSLVLYDSLIDDWEPTIRRCGEELDVEWREFTVPLRGQIAKVIRADLRHSDAGLDELESASCPAPVLSLYEMLLSAATDPAGLGESDEERLSHLWETHSAYSELLSHDRRIGVSSDLRPDALSGDRGAGSEEIDVAMLRFSAILEQRATELAEVRASAVAREAQVQELNRLVGSAEDRLRDVTELYRQREVATDALLAETKEKLKGKEKDLEGARDSLTQAESELSLSRQELSLSQQELEHSKDLLRAKDREAEEIREELSRKSRDLTNSQQDLEEAVNLLEEKSIELESASARLEELSGQVEILREHAREADEMYEQTLETTAARVNHLHEQLEMLYASKSWRITAPMRDSVALARKIRRRLARMRGAQGGQ
jgi:hypothetical protein